MRPLLKRIDFGSPYTCMAVVVAVYGVKVVFKLAIGAQVGSIAMRSDGFHNLSDILEALIVVFAIYVAGRPRSRQFPLGLAAVENIVSLLIGVLVMLLGLSFFGKSLVGLLGHYGVVPELLRGLIGAPENPFVEGRTFVYAIAVAAVSIALSWATSRYQISLGERLKSPSLVSDGKESLSDSLTELSVLVGVLGKSLGLPQLDPIAGLLVAFFILRTGLEMIITAGKVLLNASIEKEEMDEISAAILETKGVKQVTDLYAYAIGKDVFSMAEVAVAEHERFGAIHHLRSSIERKIMERAPCVSRVFLTFVPEEPERQRCLLAIGKDRALHTWIAQDFLKARSYVVLDVLGDRIDKTSISPNTFKSPQELLDFMKKKKVQKIYWAAEPPALKGKLSPGIRTEETAAMTLGDLFAA